MSVILERLKIGAFLMEELQQLQAVRLKRLLDDQNISQKDLAEMLKVSPTSVNHWVNGKVHMNDYNARLICEKYPEYSPDYLRGYSDYQNAKAEESARAFVQFSIENHVEKIALSRGFEAQLIMQFSQPENSERPEYCGFYKVIRNSQNETLRIPDEIWSAFVDEVCDYVEMRLNQMMKRGAW